MTIIDFECLDEADASVIYVGTLEAVGPVNTQKMERTDAGNDTLNENLPNNANHDGIDMSPEPLGLYIFRHLGLYSVRKSFFFAFFTFIFGNI